MLSGDGNTVSKRSRNQQVNGTVVDRISDLPESVLLHILSFLSAIYVVRTSVLSRRWQYVWTGVPNLKFGGELYGALPGGDKYVNFVNGFLFQYKATSIRMLRIESHVIYYSPDTERWIRWAINRNVEEIYISFSNSSPVHHLPQTIFGCKTLVALKLKDQKVRMVFPPSACIPCLKTLELDSVNSPDDEFEKKLISCCGILENLYIKRDHYDKKIIRVHAQQLKRLKIVSCSYYGTDQNKNGVIDINTPALQDLDIKDGRLSSLLLANVGNISNAKIHLNGSNAFQSLLECFSAFKNMKSLHLSSGYTTQACILRPGLTVHNMNLTRLTLEVGSVWVQLLPYFFRCFLNLEVLRLVEKKSSHWDGFADGNLCLPRGLLSRLRVFVVETFSGTNDELGMLKYILENGKALDLVQLQYLCSGQTTKEYMARRGTKAHGFEKKFIDCEEKLSESEKLLQIAQMILDFPRASEKCRIKLAHYPNIVKFYSKK